MRVVIGGWAWIDLKTAPPDLPAKLRKQLTIKRRKVGDHPGDAPKLLYMFAEREGFFGVPRAWFFANQQQQHDIEYQVSDGAPWPGELRFKRTLYDEQQRAMDTFLPAMRASRTFGGIAKCSTGWGKTVLASALVSEIKCTTLVLVHKEFLVEQWREELEGALEGVKVGIVQGSKHNVVGNHVVIAMMQTLASRGISNDLRSWPGLIISDEVHRTGADTWCTLIPLFSSRYRAGLSATPKRRDNAEAAFTQHIGPVIFHGKVLRLIPKIRRVWTHFKHKGPTTGPMQKILLLKALCADKARNLIIVGQLHEAVRAGRKILCLSERVQHLVDLDKMFSSTWDSGDGEGAVVPETFHFTKEAAADLSIPDRNVIFDRCSCVFSTFQLVSEAFNYPPFDTLCLSTPIFDVEQSAGRVLRPSETKKPPVIIDMRDDGVGFCRRFGDERDKFYQQIGA